MSSIDPAPDASPGEPSLAKPSAKARWRLALRIAEVRLRFLLVFAVGFVIIGQWERIGNYWDKCLQLVKGTPAVETVSVDTEYFCPMDPGVLSDWPSKCPICNMTLVRRKRGDASPLPEGVVARMQLSPYRLQLGGIRTAAVEYRALYREIATVGTVASNRSPPLATGVPKAIDSRALQTPVAKAAPSIAAGSSLQVDAELFAKDWPFVAVGQAAEVRTDALPGVVLAGSVAAKPPAPPAPGETVPVHLAVDAPTGKLAAGMPVTVRIRVPAADLEPFCHRRSPPPLRPADLREVYYCPDHPDVLRAAPDRCPHDQQDLQHRLLADNQRLEWWCPMHPEVVSPRPGSVCAACGGMKLVPHVLSYGPPGQVLAVPDSAVLDTGTHKVVYVEQMPGMFDGVEVVTGPRCGAYFPVIRGVEAGQRVATQGAFLLDAETRLNPSLASAYFGAGRPNAESASRSLQAPGAGATGARPPSVGASATNESDRGLIERQKVCPVTGQPLGSMGKPPKIVVQGRTVFVCCEGCIDELKSRPDKYLAKLPKESSGR